MRLTKKIVAFFILGLLLLPAVSRVIQANETPTSVNINFTGIFDVENDEIDFVVPANYGALFSLEAPSKANYSFAYWIINGVVRYDLGETDSIRVTSNMNLSAVYSPTGKNTVLFIDSNGEILGTEFVTTGQTVMSPDLVSHVGKPGLSVKLTDTWKTPQGTVYTEELVINANTVFVLQYETSSEETFSVVVNNGTGSGTFAYNEIVTVNANPVEFSHWEENGVVVSRNLAYSFTLVSNRTLTAVSLATPQANTPLVIMTNDLEVRSGHHTYMGQFYIPDNFELVEYGFIISKNIEAITRGSQEVIVAQSNFAHSITNEYVMSFLIGSHFTARAYLVLKDNLDNFSTIYSVNVVNTPVIYDKHETFNNSSLSTSSTSYASGQHLGDDGYLWTYVDTRGDVAVNGKAIMLRNNATTNISTEITGGIGHLQLTFTKAFTSDAAVKLSINNVLIATSETSTVANTPLIFNVYNINISGPLSVKLETTGGQLLIDDIKWTDYGSDLGFSPTFSGIANSTSLIGDSFDVLFGISANDIEDGNLTSSIVYSIMNSSEEVLELPVDFSLLPQGDYTVTYTVTDSLDNTTQLSKTHTVSLGNSPVIIGAVDVELTVDSLYDHLEGISASDIEDGDTTSSIVTTILDELNNVVASVNTGSEGIYTVSYSVEDSHGNISTVEITVTITSGSAQLSSPTNLSISSNELLTWDAVANAESYTVKIGTYTFADLTTNSLDLKALTLLELPGNFEYQVAIIANGDNIDYIDSILSFSIDYLRLRYSDLVITGYYYDNTSGANVKTIAIFNGTGSTKTLTDYRLCQWSNVSTSGVTTINGCTGQKADSSSINPTYTLSFGGTYQTTIAPNETIIIGTTTASFTTKANSLGSNLYINASFNFNGAAGDVLVLSRGTNVTIDIIGQPGTNLTWESSYTSGKKLLVRKPITSGPNTAVNWLDSNSVIADWTSTSNVSAANVTDNYFNWAAYSEFNYISIPE